MPMSTQRFPWELPALQNPSANHTYFWSGDSSRIRTWHGVQAESRPQGDSRGACCKRVAYGPASSCSSGCYEGHNMPSYKNHKYIHLTTKLENQQKRELAPHIWVNLRLITLFFHFVISNFTILTLHHPWGNCRCQVVHQEPKSRTLRYFLMWVVSFLWHLGCRKRVAPWALKDFWQIVDKFMINYGKSTFWNFLSW